jgi:ribosomal protein L16 Arg81 hydroxylase
MEAQGSQLTNKYAEGYPKLAGLALEEEFESRLITGAIHAKKWSLRNGVFTPQDFSNL